MVRDAGTEEISVSHGALLGGLGAERGPRPGGAARRLLGPKVRRPLDGLCSKHAPTISLCFGSIAASAAFAEAEEPPPTPPPPPAAGLPPTCLRLRRRAQSARRDPPGFGKGKYSDFPGE